MRGAVFERDDRHEDVFEDGALGKMMRLKDEPDLLVADGGELQIVEAADVLAVEQHLALGGAIEGADDVKQGALAGAGGPDNG